MTKALDLAGQKFGRLTVIERAENANGGRVRWQCVCDCGNKVTVRGSSMKSGRSLSCGCLKIEMCVKHGFYGTPIYNCWKTMLQRCTKPSHPAWEYYGGRGISVCDRWLNDLEAFIADMGPKPTPKHSIDRIDPNGNYEPSNCRWATADEQANNKRPRNTKQK